MKMQPPAKLDTKTVLIGSIGVATSAVEIGVGIVLLEPPTTPFGVGLVLHGALNTAAATGSLVTYVASDGNISLPGTALGMVSYVAWSGSPNQATVGVMADGIAGSILLSPVNAPKTLTTISNISFALSNAATFTSVVPMVFKP